MLKGIIEFEGKTYSDVESAIDEAKKEILRILKIGGSGITSGFDRNDGSNHSFEIGDKRLFIEKTKKGKDEGGIRELAEAVRKWMEEQDGSPYKSIRLVHVIPILVTAVTNLEKRVSKLENSEETRELIKRGG